MSPTCGTLKSPKRRPKWIEFLKTIFRGIPGHILHKFRHKITSFTALQGTKIRRQTCWKFSRKGGTLKVDKFRLKCLEFLKTAYKSILGGQLYNFSQQIISFNDLQAWKGRRTFWTKAHVSTLFMEHLGCQSFTSKFWELPHCHRLKK